ALFCLTQSWAVGKKPLLNFKISGYAQGTTYYVSYFAEDSLVSSNDLDLVLAGIDSSLSLYKPYSIINKFNHSKAGTEIDGHFKTVYIKSAEVAKRTDGLFDVTVQPLVQAWGFGAKKASS